MADNPMVGYAYRYVSAYDAYERADRVLDWAFVHWAAPAFDGFGSCVRYEVRLVLPIMDGGHVFRHLRKPEQWAADAAFKSTISEQAKKAAQADLEAEIGEVYKKTGPSKRALSWEETVGRQLSALRDEE